jgi:hypothetical protein
VATPAEPDSVQLLLELRPTDDDGVSGVVTSPDTGHQQPFGGWLELLQLLEAAISRPASNGTPPNP